MDYWHKIDKTMLDGPFKVQIQYRYSDDIRFEDHYPDDSPEEISEMYRQVERHESFVFDVRLSYIYNEHILSSTSLHCAHYDDFPEDVILSGMDGEIEMMMVEAKEEATKKAKELLDNLQNDFGEAL
jgi:hypothetical protein